MESPGQRPSPRPLRAILRERRIQSFVATAEFIRDYPDCPERMAEAERFIREIMIEIAPNSITEEERSKIFDVLSFAMPPLPEYLARGEQAE